MSERYETSPSRGQKLANWDTAGATNRQSSTGSNRSNRSNRSNQSNRSDQSNRSSRAQQDFRSDESSSDSDDMSDLTESDDDRSSSEDDDDLTNVDDVAAAMRNRAGASMSFNRDWEDVYLADELRLQAHNRDPSKSNDGLPNECIVLLLVIMFATSLGLIAHYLLKFQGYHDFEHADIMEGEL
jgi:hypothetical protein